MARQAVTPIGASHVTTPSMVAMLGWIIPDPLPMPPILTTRPPPRSTSTAIVLRTRSVVQMAVAAASATSSSARRFAASAGMPAVNSSILMRWPMTPVDSTSTSGRDPQRTPPRSAAVARLSSMPRDPVAAFACPAFTSTARAVSDASTISRQYNTGAAAKTFVVNTPAKTAGSSATTSAHPRVAPDARRPALWAAALNPPGGHHAAGNHLPRSRREERFDGRGRRVEFKRGVTAGADAAATLASDEPGRRERRSRGAGRGDGRARCAATAVAEAAWYMVVEAATRERFDSRGEAIDAIRGCVR